MRIHGRIDILLNNAAYILEGAIEEISHAEALALFNTNVFGQLAVLRAVLPVMRKQRSGVVGNMGSIGGWRGIPAGGMYSATKFTLAGISLALKLEVADLGIDVTLIEPGYFRTDFLAGGHKATAEKRIDDLATSTAPYRRALKDYNHKQPGDPVKGAGLIVEALTKSGRCEGRGTLPGRFLMGSDAVSLAEEALAHWKKELDEWKDLAVTTDHDN